MEERRYTAQQLADVVEISVHTVRKYARMGIIPNPFMRGRGAHFTDDHLFRLLYFVPNNNYLCGKSKYAGKRFINMPSFIEVDGRRFQSINSKCIPKQKLWQWGVVRAREAGVLVDRLDGNWTVTPERSNARWFVPEDWEC